MLPKISLVLLSGWRGWHVLRLGGAYLFDASYLRFNVIDILGIRHFRQVSLQM